MPAASATQVPPKEQKDTSSLKLLPLPGVATLAGWWHHMLVVVGAGCRRDNQDSPFPESSSSL